MIFFTPQTQHLASRISGTRGIYTSKRFSDNEIFIKLESDVAGKKVWVIAAIFPPAEYMLELFFLLDALQKAGAQVYLLLTYCGYSRQDRAKKGEAVSAQVVCNFLKTFALKKIVVIHEHSVLLHNYLEYENVIPLELIQEKALLVNALAAPDKGAYDLVCAMSSLCKKEAIFLTKIRPEQEKVKILQHDGIVKSRKILIIDDIISTGNTIAETSRILHDLGATEIHVWATHGIFTGNAFDIIANSVIKKVYVTNTLPQTTYHEKIEVIDIAPLIQEIIHKEK